MRERLGESQEEVRKVVGFLKNTVDKDNLNRDLSKEGKQKKLQERLQEIQQLHFQRSTEKLKTSSEDYLLEKSLPFDKYKEKEYMERK